MSGHESRRWSASLLIAAALAACGSDSGSPTQPSASDANEIRIGDLGPLSGQGAAIQSMLTATLGRVTEALPLTGVTITVVADAGRAIGGYGVGGFTPDGRTVQLFLDPSFPGIAELLPSRLPPILAHEFHHAARWRGPGYGNTLLQAMVSEGLADRFSIELLGAPVPPWCRAFPEEETASYLELARGELDSTTYSHDLWFFGSGATVPRWTGYTLGYRLVEAYEAEHRDATAAKAVNVPAGEFRP